MSKQLLATSANGLQVFYDDSDSHAAMHFDSAPALRGLVIEVINKLELSSEDIKDDFDLGRVVGVSDVVRTDKNDEIVYGMRRNCELDGLVPFVKNRKGAPCQSVAIHILAKPDGTYELSSAWIGTFSGEDEPFPQAPDANEESVDFWHTHAFVYGSQEIVEGTETNKQPW